MKAGPSNSEVCSTGFGLGNSTVVFLGAFVYFISVQQKDLRPPGTHALHHDSVVF